MNSVFVDLLGGPYLPDDEQHYDNTDIMASRTIFTSEFQEEVKGQIALNAAARTLEAAALAPRIEVSGEENGIPEFGIPEEIVP